MNFLNLLYFFYYIDLKNYSKHILLTLILISTVLAFNGRRCNICYGEIESDYLKDAWGNIFHKEHEKTAEFCESCYRVVSVAITDGGYYLPDNRLICNLCYQSSVNSYDEALKILDMTIEYLSNNGINIDSSYIKLNLIFKNEIRLDSNNHLNYKAFTILNKSESLSSHEIFILKGLPSQEFSSILAHELMHIWIAENNIKIENELEEYYCNLVARDLYSVDINMFSSIKQNSIDIHLDDNKYDSLFCKKNYSINEIIEHIHDY